MKKKIIGLGLSTTILMSGMVFATEVEKVELKDDKEIELISIKKDLESNFKRYNGKITEIIKNDDKKSRSIMVEAEDENSDFDLISFNLSEETLILTDKTRDGLEIDKIKEGMTVEAFYSKDKPMTTSLPPITNADVLVVREAEKDSKESMMSVKVDTFIKSEHTKRLSPIDNSVELTISDETVIVDREGNTLKEEDIVGKNLVAFYGPIMTMSLPPQSPAVKIIALGENKVEIPEVTDNEIKVFDKYIYRRSGSFSAEVKLKNKMYISGGTVMMPLREIAETLGYEVFWNSEARQAELIKGANFLTASADRDSYSFAKMLIKLGKESELEKGTIYVPTSFVKEVMKLEMDVTEDGVMNIK